MSFARFLDDVGNTFLCRPMAKVHDFRFLHFFDDMGILLVCKPLRYVDENWPVDGVVWLVRDIIDR
ncbi:hypothetical protein OIDMADRAFT_47959 [Oidiodendron maius Zn]|uniref:Uncharacterized protein n=1 Tax=Oidiodendron maius (strain Zn) TaxID=913774 RepID=A0A0C3E1B5_OIDMZ|nr:hypothetical protein OIDMADRAFT_47959 [Oidiodendron maius Zn]